MASHVLHPLVCTKCGASLPAEEGQTVLVCPFCGQTHAFVPPPLEPGPGGARSAPNPKLALTIALVGLAVVLSAGIAFSVLRSVATPGATPTDAAAEAVAGDPNATYAVGDPVDIRWGSAWWPGSIKKKDGKRYRITYEGYSESWDEWVTPTRLRPRTPR